MRILFVIHTPKDPRTAVYGYVLERTAFLKERGHETLIIAPADFPAIRTLPSRWFPIAFPIALARWLRHREQPIDLVVFHSFSGWASLVLRRLGWLKGIKAITQFHGLEPLVYRTMRDEVARRGRPFRLRFRLFNEIAMPLLLRLACRSSDFVFCLNSAEQRYLRKRSWADPNRLAIVANSVEDDFFVERSYPSSATSLLFLGQWLERKGTTHLVEAFTLLAAEFPSLRLWLVGTRVEPSEVLESFAPSLRPRITVVPSADRQEIIGHLARCHVFVFPSLAEGFSLALLEAMATGLPLVTTPVGAAPDLLEDNVSALFVPAGDAASLAAALRRLLADLELRERLGRGARKAAEPYSWQRLRNSYAALLEGVGAEASA